MKKIDFKKYKLPENPGIYFFLDKKLNKKFPSKENVLYIGKATSLTDRVGSYFSNDLQNTRGLKISSMIENAKDIFFVEAKSVFEAIILESKYIKEYQPFFNTRDKDNKSYSFVVITKEDFPKVLIMRERELEKTDTNIAEKFGPFVSKSELISVMKVIRKVFPYRDKCKLDEKRGCFNFQIGLCPGTCIGVISKAKYKKNIDSIKKILSGDFQKLIKDLEKEMHKAVKENKFEEAALFRDKLRAFNSIRDISFIKNKDSVNFNLRMESYDVSHISGTNRVGVMCVFEDGELKKSEYKKFKLKEKTNDDLEGLKEILKRRFTHKEWRYPDLVVIDGGKTHLEFLKRHLDCILKKEDLNKISFISVVKDSSHKAREVLFFDKDTENKYKNLKKDIILLNNDTHRFAISYHKLLRNKIR